MRSDPGTITLLLAKWSDGDHAAFQQLVELAYEDLRAIAHRRLLVGGGGDLATTALVHEAYLRLLGRVDGQWESRGHFYAVASKAMRQILVDHARQQQAERRGGSAVQIALDDGMTATDGGLADVLGIHEALDQLAVRNPRMAQVVEMRFFGGLSIPEVAEVLAASVRTVEREWTRARSYLLESLANESAGP
jgi:RNA polymerase sigma factor (TIGR02999 family)